MIRKRYKRISRIVSIRTPAAFRHSINTLKKGGFTTQEKRSLVLAKNRAVAMLHRKNLSAKERAKMRAIARTRI